MTPHAARCLRSVLVALACFAVSAFAWADVFRPAYLELRELGGDRYDVLLKVPAQGDDLRLSIDVRFPSGTVEVEPRRSQFLADSHTQRWRVERTGGLVDTSIEIFGRAAGVTEVLARVERLDGTTQVDSLPPGRATFVVKPSLGFRQTAVTYLLLGVEHILGGVDHLLFVLSLLLIVRGFKRIAVTITAFTLAHSITLAAATLGFVRVPGPPVEASHRAQHRIRRGGSRAQLARQAGPDGARTVGRRVLIRSAARLRFRGRARGGGAAAEGDPDRVVHFQRWRGDRPAAVRGCGDDGGRALRAIARAHAALERLGTALFNRCARDVLGCGAHRRVLIGETNEESQCIRTTT